MQSTAASQIQRLYNLCLCLIEGKAQRVNLENVPTAKQGMVQERGWDESGKNATTVTIVAIHMVATVVALPKLSFVYEGKQKEWRCSIGTLQTSCNLGTIAHCQPQIQAQTIRKRIGSTTYIVNVNFSKTSQETAEDKVLRLLKREVESA